VTSALLLVFEALIILVLCLDLGQDLQALSAVDRGILVLLASAGAMLAVWPRFRGRFDAGVRQVLMLLAAGALLIGVAGLVVGNATTRVASQWDVGGRARLEARATALVSGFSWLLDEVVRPLALASGARPSDQEAAFRDVARIRAFSRLPADRQGFSTYRPDGTLLAWDGNCTAPPEDLLADAASTPLFRVAGGEASPRLYSVISDSLNLRWVSELALKPPATEDARVDDRGVRLEFLPHWDDASPAYLQAAPQPPGRDELSIFFAGQGDRYWRRLGGQGGLMLSLPLRAPGGQTLVVASLADKRLGMEIAAWRGAARRAGALLAATVLGMACVLLLVRQAMLSPAARLLLGTFGIWSVRAALLLYGGGPLPPPRLFDVTVYASSAFGGLARSPADLLLTAMACLGQVALLRRFLERRAPPRNDRTRRRIRAAALLAAALATVGGLFGLHAFVDRMVLDARTDISRVELAGRALAPLVLQAALFFVVAALAALILALVDTALRDRVEGSGWRLLRWLKSGRVARLPFPLSFTVGVFLVTLLYAPFLQHAYERLRRDFFEDDLVPRVLHQEEQRSDLLRQSLAMVEEPEFAAGARFAFDDAGAGLGLAAHRLWYTTPMADMGLASSLEIFTREGRLLSRFAVNLAPRLQIPFPDASAAAGSDIVRVPPRPHQTVRKTVIFGARWLQASRRPPLLVVMTVIDDYDNLPFLGSETAYLSLFRTPAVARTNPELLRFDPMVAVFGPNLERVHSSGGEIPPPPPDTLRSLEGHRRVWSTDDVGEGMARIVYFRGPREIFALGLPVAGPIDRLAAFLRLFLLNTAVAAIGLGVVWLGGCAARGQRPRVSLGTTFYGRLTAAFILTALVPLLSLAYFVSRFSRQEFERDITTSGLVSLQVARRVAEDYLVVSGQDEPPALDDDVVFWLSRVVRQDLNVYQGADLLATSTRELYTSALMNTRLDGDVYRALYLDREPFMQDEDRIGGVDYLTLSAPMKVDRAGTIGVISIPLSAHRRAVERKAEDVEGAILISTCLTVLLLAVVGWRVARRVSGPIALLAEAARRVEEGNLDVSVSAAARHEIAFLVEAFNRMARSLRGQREDLRRRKDYIEKILARATTGVVSIDASGAVITINPAAENLLAAGAAAIRPGENLPGRLEREPSLKPLHSSLLQALSAAGDKEAELAVTRGGTERRLRAIFLPFAPEEGSPPGRIILLEDITDIVRSGRLAAWAEMARRIAHEVKNPLTPIQLSVEHIRRLWEAGDSRFGEVLGQCLDNIQGQVRVLRRIASEFSDYARLPRLRAEPTAVDAIVNDALGPYAAAPPPGISVACKIPGGLPLVLADRAVIGRALVNLIENALQAMVSGGTLSVGAVLLDGPGGRPRVRIEVRDTGTGIDPALRERIFEPYFSTKSGGTGLGLALARRAVEEHGGKIAIESRPGEGTIVSLELPTDARDGGAAGA
jgi:signal transduction histidine kinase/HAMP domain-containing protein